LTTPERGLCTSSAKGRRSSTSLGNEMTQAADPPLLRLDQLRLVALDVDGVLTDGRKVYTADGFTGLEFDVRDGLGLHMLLLAGLEIALVTNTRSEIVARRAADLGVSRVLQGVDDKGLALRQLLGETGVEPAHALFIGDDVWDLPAFEEVGVAVAVRGAVAAVERAAVWVTNSEGGRGAVREVADAILRAKALDSRALLGLQPTDRRLT
jgi:3-deoxy-D-manno-octulosonate 8-phosphate phosphatase (KDO 8-P phosphatase)